MADCAVVPPAPVQVSVKVLLAVSAPVEAEPDVALLPLHAPLAVQLVAFVDDQVSVLALPLVTLVGLALMVTVGAGFTVTVVDCAAVPPAPLQLSVNVLSVVSAPVEAVPDVALLPVHAPLAVQLVAFVDDQVSVLALPLATLLGLALIVTAGSASTVTVVDCAAVPPAPLQLSVNVLSVVSAPVEAVPDVALLPVHAPLAVQLVAFVDDQVSVLALPLATLLGLALNVTVGSGSTVTVVDCAAVPPAPVQLSVNVLSVANAPVEAVPDVALLPVHAPLAVQLVALVDDHVSMLELPLTTLLGLALNVTVGRASTVTVVDCAAVPPVPVQLSVKVLFVVNAPVEAVPDVPLLPIQAPLAVQLVALVDDHVSVLALPLATLLGLALIATVGAEGALTVTVTDCTAVPPTPVQLSVNVLWATSAPVDSEPEIPLLSDHDPLAVQLVAFVDDHVSVLALPLTTLLGFAPRVTDGSASTVTVVDCAAVPPAPRQLSVNVLFADSAPVEAVPDVALLPVHAPLAVQLVAFVDAHVSVLLPPLATLLGLALSVTVGNGSTVTVVDCAAVPPAPVQVSVYVLSVVSAMVEAVPDVALLPVHAPLAVQLVALIDDHVKVLVPPIATLLGLALSVTVGSASTVTVVDCAVVPPGPVHANVNVPLVVSAPVEEVPETCCEPDHAPLA